MTGSIPSHARTIEVSASGPLISIQSAIAIAEVGDSIVVSPGRYVENIDFLGKGIVLRSANGPEVTIIDGSSRDSSTVVLKDDEPVGTVLEGFTITGGSGSVVGGGRDGGGIFCFRGSPTIRHNIITNNHATFGGGIRIGRNNLLDPSPLSTPIIEQNTIGQNSASANGGGILVQNANSMIRNNVIDSNVAGSDGGGIEIYITAGSCTAEDNTIEQNVARDQGGGILAFSESAFHPGPVHIRRNLIIRNEAWNGEPADIGAGGGIGAGMSGTIERNTIVDNFGTGELGCGGGGIRLVHTGSGLTIQANIIARNRGCGVRCYQAGAVVFGSNLFWANEGGNFAVTPETCPDAVTVSAITADPQFCNPDDGDYRVASSSPALSGPLVMGAYAEPGCPGIAVTVTTWGAIKARWGD